MLRKSKYCKVSGKRKKMVLISQYTVGEGSLARRGPTDCGTYCKYLKKQQKGIKGE